MLLRDHHVIELIEMREEPNRCFMAGLTRRAVGFAEIVRGKGSLVYLMHATTMDDTTINRLYVHEGRGLFGLRGELCLDTLKLTEGISQLFMRHFACFQARSRFRYSRLYVCILADVLTYHRD